MSRMIFCLVIGSFTLAFSTAAANEITIVSHQDFDEVTVPFSIVGHAAEGTVLLYRWGDGAVLSTRTDENGRFRISVTTLDGNVLWIGSRPDQLQRAIQVTVVGDTRERSASIEKRGEAQPELTNETTDETDDQVRVESTVPDWRLERTAILVGAEVGVARRSWEIFATIGVHVPKWYSGVELLISRGNNHQGSVALVGRLRVPIAQSRALLIGSLGPRMMDQGFFVLTILASLGLGFDITRGLALRAELYNAPYEDFDLSGFEVGAKLSVLGRFSF